MGFTLLNSIAKRTISFIVRKDADYLWKSVTTVRPGGRKKGRMGKMRKPKDLNKGQVLGQGKINVSWPGLTTNIVDKGTKTLEQFRYQQPNKQREENLMELRNVKREKLKRVRSYHPMERGYSGTKWGGRPIQNPDPIGDEDWRDFKTFCTYANHVTKMNSNGRVRLFQIHLVMGNGNGLISFAKGEAKSYPDAIDKSRNDLPKRLQYVPRLNNHTIYQSFMGEFKGVRVLAHPMPWGYGLSCHRAIKIMCDLVGIKDLCARADGNYTNYYNVAHGFLIGLLSQETHQELAERTQMHVLEYRKETGNLPVIVASPAKGAKEQTGRNDIVDVEEFYSEGRQPYAKPKFDIPWYLNIHRSVSYRRKVFLEHPFRNQKEVQMRMLGDFIFKDWTTQERDKEAKREHLKVLRGEKPMPIGIGLPGIYRDTLEDEVKKKKSKKSKK